ncbi:MAG: family 10 glycosylhydrolase [Candidatus Latescibacteria bacterium]|nr:family 10 glycosylhydrolase [Candidatus Latescibacterota bacterium]
MDETTIPTIPREFRGVWVTTVGNGNWPSRRGLPVCDQRSEALAILDRCLELRLNAVVFQVRPQCDALYASSLEPWSYYLTGQEGKPPDPLYDPLEFWVEEAHRRGLELHAWFNPYRAKHASHKGESADSSMAKTRPDLALHLGSKGYVWLDPAHSDTQAHSLAVVMDVVDRYDVDGIHFDDYFYPYPDYNDGRDFPDDESWSAYRAAGGDLPRDDWRRHSVDTFVRKVHEGIRSRSPHVKFGISPFGIWRPGHPAGIEGFDAYDVLFADARLWLTEGWVDYLTPQLYWPSSQIPPSFPVRLGWWASQNEKGRHLWPGLYTGRVAPDGWPAREAVDQVMVSRGMLPSAPGHVHFHANTLMGDCVGSDGKEVGSHLLETVYPKAALVPACPWLSHRSPDPPQGATSSRQGDETAVSWTGVPDAFLYVICWSGADGWQWQVLPRGTTACALPAADLASEDPQVAVSAVDRLGNESTRAVVSL